MHEGTREGRPHYGQSKTRDNQKPTVSVDYKTLGEYEHSDDRITAIVLRDNQTRMTFGHICQQKGSSDEWIVKKILDDLDQLGHFDMIFKGDGEPALVQVMKEIRKKRIHTTLLENPPAYDPQSDGSAEKTVQEYTEQFRAEKTALEDRIKATNTTDMPIMHLMSEHCAMLLCRYQMGADGKTPYRRRMGKNCKAMAV